MKEDEGLRWFAQDLARQPLEIAEALGSIFCSSQESVLAIARFHDEHIAATRKISALLGEYGQAVQQLGIDLSEMAVQASSILPRLNVKGIIPLQDQDFMKRAGSGSAHTLSDSLNGITEEDGETRSHQRQETHLCPGHSKPLIVLPPGSRLSRCVECFYSKRTVGQVFFLIIADMQHEYIEALAKGEKWKARWVRLRGYWGFFNAMGLQSIVGLVKKIWGIWKAI